MRRQRLEYYSSGHHSGWEVEASEGDGEKISHQGQNQGYWALPTAKGSLISSPGHKRGRKPSREPFVSLEACVPVGRNLLFCWSCFSLQCPLDISILLHVGFFSVDYGWVMALPSRRFQPGSSISSNIVQYGPFMLQELGINKNWTSLRRFYGENKPWAGLRTAEVMCVGEAVPGNTQGDSTCASLPLRWNGR